MTQPIQPERPLPRDPEARLGLRPWMMVAVIALGVIALGTWLRKAAGSRHEVLVLYCAQDMSYAEPLLRDFEQRTGWKVAVVYDSEAVKTVGLANRLLAERDRPRCDVFWGNEELRTRQLASRGVFRPTNGWTAFGFRSRRIVVNTNKLPLAQAPGSLLELTNACWRGKIALAYPQFGSTSTHFHALRQQWGEGLWRQWCEAIAANKPFLLEGNSSVVQMVGRGIALVGLTDSDDIAAAQREGAPVEAQPLGPDALLLPNTVGLIQKAQIHPGAEALYQFLQSPGTVEQLVAAEALESADRDAPEGGTLKPDWDRLLADLDTTAGDLKRFFLK